MGDGSGKQSKENVQLVGGRPARLSGESPSGRGRPTASLLGIQPACSLLEPWAELAACC